MTSKAVKTGELATLLEEVEDMANNISMLVEDLNPARPQSLSNDFSEPLVMAEALVKLCNKLMDTADELAEIT